MMPAKLSIIDYRIQPDDDLIYNPYLHDVMKIIAKLKENDENNLPLKLLEHRSALVTKYSFSIPTIDLLRCIASYSPIVEIGAGTGYWAMCLASLGVDIIAFDKRVPGNNHIWDFTTSNPWHDDTWFAVEEGDEQMASHFHERSLFLCWPPLESSMAYEAAMNHKKNGGKRIIFLGSRFSCANEEFFKFLSCCKYILQFETYSWPAVEEILCVAEYS